MEEYPKLWENEVFMMWKAGSLEVDVSLAMNFVSTCHMEYDAQRIILDISDAMIIHYPVAQGDESIKAWQHELETQSQGVGQNADAAWHRLLILESKAKERLSTMYNIQSEYLVEVFKYPGTGDRVPPDAPDGYRSMSTIGLYGLVDRIPSH